MKVSIQGSIKAQTDAAVRDVAGALRRAVDRVGRETQAELRAIVKQAGFRKGGQAVANAWRLKSFPAPGRAVTTWRPAALVYSKMPDIVDGFDRSQVIAPRGGGMRMAIPTKYNLKAVRRGKREVIFTTMQMSRLTKEGAARLAPSRRNRDVLVWYLRVAKTPKRSRLRGKSWVERKYRFGNRRLSSKGIERQWVPMFTLIKPYHRERRWDLASVAERARARLATEVRLELDRLAA